MEHTREITPAPGSPIRIQGGGPTIVEEKELEKRTDDTRLVSSVAAKPFKQNMMNDNSTVNVTSPGGSDIPQEATLLSSKGAQWGRGSISRPLVFLHRHQWASTWVSSDVPRRNLETDRLETQWRRSLCVLRRPSKWSRIQSDKNLKEGK